MGQYGDAATGMTSVLSTKPLQTVHCEHRRTLHHCGDPVRFQTTVLTSCGFLGIGKCACTAHFPSLAKLLAYVHLIKVAITRHGSTWISSIGAALNHSMKSMTDEFSSKSVLCHLTKGRRGGEPVISRATIRSLHERATILHVHVNTVRKFLCILHEVT